LAGCSFFAAIGALAEKLTERLPAPLRWFVQALTLKATFSLNGLDRAANEVQAALEEDDLDGARQAVSWHLVSRDTSTLNASRVAAATIESVAENASDGIIAPLFFYTLGGLPAALAYRFANTADSMLGYRDAAREWLGKFPARFDDLLNFVPARLTGLLIVLASPFQSGSMAKSWQIMRRDASTTDSPNAGYPMSAMAGALEVELEKVGQYNLGQGQREPRSNDIKKARGLVAVATGLVVAIFVLCSIRDKA
jgi:adenosylcobinamide-phosphate synthase